MEIFGVIGILCFLLSFMYLFRPHLIKKLDDFGKNLFSNASKLIESSRIVIGIFFFVVGVFLAYIGFLWGV